MITVKSFTFNAFSENTYVVYDETKKTLIIDPGCYEVHEQEELDEFIKSFHLDVSLILNTHCHIDHVLGNDFVKRKYNVPFLAHKLEEGLLRAVKSYAPNYGFNRYKEVIPDRFISEKNEVTWGNSQFDVLFLPGHSPGHLGFYNPEQKILISGDVLFKDSIGRTDLPGGDMDTLIESIQQKLFILPDEVIVYSGHGDPTTIGIEKVTNPFCALST
ncbi:MAG TPA: MBL fold metallo-hydrolase [Cyclobacteriaceae bacterium]